MNVTELRPPREQLAKALTELAQRVWTGCAALGGDMCNVALSVEDAKALETAAKLLRASAKTTGEQR